MYNNYDIYHPTIKAEYNKKHDWWILLCGPNTFYNEKRELMTWDTKEEALAWARENHPEYEIIE